MNNKPTLETSPQKFGQEFQLIIEALGDIKANVLLLDWEKSGRQIINGTLRGPRCTTAHTLSATMKLSRSNSPTLATTAIVPDPCYWSPTLPMLYDLAFDVQESSGDPSGDIKSYQYSIGLRRLETDCQNLLLNRERIVLRGVLTADNTIDQLPEAHELGVTLITRNPTIEFVQQASQLGVFIIADLREVNENLQNLLRQLAIEPAIAAVIVNDPSELDKHLPSGLHLAQAIGPNDNASTVAPWANLVLVELNENQRPPCDLISCDKPILAVEQNDTAVPIENVRRACDKLQSRLAPEFNLAGYFTL